MDKDKREFYKKGMNKRKCILLHLNISDKDEKLFVRIY